MRIFLSWSGDQSRAVAEALREWLPYVLPNAQPWLSSTDIDRGARWSQEITDQLDKADVGLICLTPQNLEAPWILFEAGALSKALTRSLVCTYLFQLQPTDVKGPLAQFQATKADKNETHQLVATLNRSLDTDAVPNDRLNKMFEVWWPELERKLASLLKAKSPTLAPHRSDRDMLEEILSLQRSNDPKALIPEIVASILADPRSVLTPVNITDQTLPRKKSSVKAKRREHILIVDTRPLIGANGDEVTITYPFFGTVSDFLDNLYYYVSHVVRASTFGVNWALKETNTGKEFIDMGRTWAIKNLHRETDNRSLEDVGIHPGMRLEAIPLSS